MIAKKEKNKTRVARHRRQRNRIKGTAEKPRLNVFRSARHIYAQLIDDTAGNTLISASTMDKEIASEMKGKTKKETAKRVGNLIGKRAVAQGFSKVVFDRGGYLYTGRIAELADGAREAGLKF